jgi:catechol 2,3-dioxygenase-like lactoylglutathione lyase family enzyme
MSAVKRTTKSKAGATKAKAGAPKPKARRATKKAAAPRRRATPAAAKPAAKKRWTPHLHDINVVSYTVSDFDRAKDFYGNTLGLPVAGEVPGWIEYGYPDQTHLALTPWSGPGPMPSPGHGPMAVFSTEEAREAIETLRAMGVQADDVIEIPDMIIYGTFYDPDGHRLQVAQSPKPK